MTFKVEHQLAKHSEWMKSAKRSLTNPQYVDTHCKGDSSEEECLLIIAPHSSVESLFVMQISVMQSSSRILQGFFLQCLPSISAYVTVLRNLLWSRFCCLSGQVQKVNENG